MKPCLPKGLNMKHLGLFMNKTFSGRLNPDKIASIRDRWKGKLVIKGIVNPEDAELAIEHRQRNVLGLAVKLSAFWSDDYASKCHGYFFFSSIFLAWASACSTAPTYMKACSGR